MKQQITLVVLVGMVGLLELLYGAFSLTASQNRDEETIVIPNKSIVLQKEVLMTIQASLTLVCLGLHFFSLKWLLLNAWVGGLAILSVALYFFGIMGSSTYQELPRDKIDRDCYFPEVFRDLGVTISNSLLSVALYEWKRLGSKYLPIR